MADEIGKKAQEFVQERVVDKKISFHVSVKKQNPKTSANQAKASLLVQGKAKKNNERIAERNVFGQLVVLALQHELNLGSVLSYPLGPVPWGLATSDGALQKFTRLD